MVAVTSHLEKSTFLVQNSSRCRKQMRRRRASMKKQQTKDVPGNRQRARTQRKRGWGTVGGREATGSPAGRRAEGRAATVWSLAVGAAESPHSSSYAPALNTTPPRRILVAKGFRFDPPNESSDARGRAGSRWTPESIG